MKQADCVKSIPFSGIRNVYQRAINLEIEGHDVIHLELGRPDFDTPIHIKEAAKKALNDGFVHYVSNYGVPLLRKLIAEKMARDNHLEVDPEREIIVTAGGTEAVFLALKATLNPGDEILVSDPAWINYFIVPKLLNLRIKSYELVEENGFKPDFRKIQGLIGKRTKMIIINSPNNPVGSILSREDLECIASIAIDRDLTVVSDEVYEKIIFEGAKHVSIAALDGLRDRVITINAFSKTYSMTGWRLGYVVAEPEIINSMIKIHQQTVGTCCSFGQYGAIEALRGPQGCVDEMVREFERRRNLVVEKFGEIHGLKCFKPSGSFYVYPNVRKTGMSGEEFAQRLLEEKYVATVPGTTFGPSGGDFIRLSIASSYERLNEATERIKDFVKGS